MLDERVHRPLVEPGTPGMREGATRPTPDQARARRAFAERAIMAGATAEQLRELIHARYEREGEGAVLELGGPMTDAHIDRLYETIVREAQERFERDRPLERGVQFERLRRDLFRARTSKATPWHAIARLEELLSKVAGTNAPLRVEIDANVGVRQSLLAVVGAMTPEEQERLVAEQVELEALVVGDGGARRIAGDPSDDDDDSHHSGR